MEGDPHHHFTSAGLTRKNPPYAPAGYMQGPASTRSLLPRDCILKGMALKRQLLVAVGAAVCLLLVYMLSNTMQIPFPYPRGRPNGFGEHGGIR